MMVKSLPGRIVNATDINDIIRPVEHGLITRANQSIPSPQQYVKGRDGTDIIRMEMAVMGGNEGLS
jgi:hypothetical protein